MINPAQHRRLRTVAKQDTTHSMSATTTTDTIHGVAIDEAIPTTFRSGSVFDAALRHGALLSPLSAPDVDRQSNAANPPWWPGDHRRMPDYRRANYHPEWQRLTSGRLEAFMIYMMFRGCEILRVSSAQWNVSRIIAEGYQYADYVPRWLGYDSNFITTHRVAGEW